jgi:hypothetical protein
MDDTDKRRLLSFIGYGPDHPRFVFLGEEEKLNGAALTGLRARARLFAFPRHDKNEALRQLNRAYLEAGYHEPAQAYLDALEPEHGRVPQWQFCAMLTAALRSPGPTVPDGPWRTSWINEYERLGIRGLVDADTLLADLFPLPKPALNKWPAVYSDLFEYRGYGEYYRRFWPLDAHRRCDRASALREALQPRGQAPEFIVQYGRGAGNEFWERFAKLLELVPTRLSGSAKPDLWHVLSENRVGVALTALGTRVARLGAVKVEGTRGRATVTDADIPTIVDALNGLEGP